MPNRQNAVRSLILLVALAFVPQAAAEANPKTVLPEASSNLSDYVKQPDSSYAWRVRQRGKAGTGDYAELILTSQTWHDIVWKHQLFIYRPAKVRESAQALLLIDGGSWSDSLENPPDESKPTDLPGQVRVITMLADMMQSPIAVVRQVPNQPIFDGRKEDQIIALTFSKYFETGQADWPLLLPMVKSAVRAMDTVQKFAQQEWQMDVQRFLVTGASKRGWTTWLTAATDPRVDALAPMVINMLNMAEHDRLQLKSFGTRSEEIRDYTERGLQEKMHTKQGESLRAIIDPIAYRAQLTQPKLIILATNDAYWPVDALNLYWKDLTGDKYILYVPNNGHGIKDYPRVAATVAALQRSLGGDKPMPKLEWRIDDQANPPKLELTSDKTPLAVRQWSAAADTRDFRQAVWKSAPVSASNGDSHQFAIDLTEPTHGFSARFLEAEFPGETVPFMLSTTLHVLGDADRATATGGADPD